MYLAPVISARTDGLFSFSTIAVDKFVDNMAQGLLSGPAIRTFSD
jgi:hypothetical protein